MRLCVCLVFVGLLAACLDSTKGTLAERPGPSACPDVGGLTTVSSDIESFSLGRCGVLGYWSGYSVGRGRAFVLRAGDGEVLGRSELLNGYGGQVVMAPDGTGLAWWHLTSDLGFGDAWVAQGLAVDGAELRDIDGGTLTVGDDFAVIGDAEVLTRVGLDDGATTVLGPYADGEWLTVTGDGRRLLVVAEASLRVFDLTSGVLLATRPWLDPVVGHGSGVVAARTDAGMGWIDANGDAYELTGARALVVVGDQVIAERDGRALLVGTTVVAIPTIGIPIIASASTRDAAVFVHGPERSLSVWTATGVDTLRRFDSEVTALALLDQSVLVAARGGPGEELFVVDRQSGETTFLRGGHDFTLQVDATGSVAAIAYTPQGGVYTALDVGDPTRAEP